MVIQEFTLQTIWSGHSVAGLGRHLKNELDLISFFKEFKVKWENGYKQMKNMK